MTLYFIFQQPALARLYPYGGHTDLEVMDNSGHVETIIYRLLRTKYHVLTVEKLRSPFSQPLLDPNDVDSPVRGLLSSHRRKEQVEMFPIWLQSKSYTHARRSGSCGSTTAKTRTKSRWPRSTRTSSESSSSRSPYPANPSLNSRLENSKDLPSPCR